MFVLFFAATDGLIWLSYILLFFQILGLIVALIRCYWACKDGCQCTGEASEKPFCYLCIESDMSKEEWEKHRIVEENVCPMMARYSRCEVTPWAKCLKCNGPLKMLWA